MKTEEIRELSDGQLRERLEDDHKELFNLRFQIETRKIKNHQRIPEVKKDIARVMTVLRERELIRLYAGEEFAHVGERETIAKKEAPRRRGIFGRNK